MLMLSDYWFKDLFTQKGTQSSFEFVYVCLSPIRHGGGGQYCPLTLERISSKNYSSQWSITFWQFLYMYILWLQTKKIIYVPWPARRAERGFKLAGQNMLCPPPLQVYILFDPPRLVLVLFIWNMNYFICFVDLMVKYGQNIATK